MSDKNQTILIIIVTVVFVGLAIGAFFIGKKQGRLKGGTA